MSVAAAMFQREPKRRPLVYAAAAAVMLLFAGMGVENGLAEVWHFLFLAVVCIAQAAYPTMLGWSIVIVPLGAYVVMLLSRIGGLPRLDAAVFLALGLLPTLGLLYARPQCADRTRRWALLAALGLASMAVGILLWVTS